jgi:hypothetical protein
MAAVALPCGLLVCEQLLANWTYPDKLLVCLGAFSTSGRHVKITGTDNVVWKVQKIKTVVKLSMNPVRVCVCVCIVFMYVSMQQCMSGL